MTSIVLILSLIIIAIVLLFLIGLYVAAIVSRKKSQRKLNTIYEASPFREKKKSPSDANAESDEFQARDERKEIVTGKAVSKAYEKHKQKEAKYQEGLVPLEKNKTSPNDTTIVDIAKPVGFWSRLIMSQKLGFLVNLRSQMNKSKHGYFVNLINAQARSQSKEKGRGL